MDIGREVKRVKEGFFSLQFFLKEKGKVVPLTATEIGKIFITNIDDKGRIYIPKELPQGDVLDHMPSSYLCGQLAVSAFQNIVYFHETIEENDYIRKARRERRPLNEIYNFKKKTGSKFLDRFDIKPFIRIETRIESRDPLAYWHKYQIELEFYPYYETSQMEYTKKKSWRDGKITVYKRYRIRIPKIYLDFLGIDCTLDKIVLFRMKGGLEIWKKQKWESFIERRIWLSTEGKFIIEDFKGKKMFVSAKEVPLFP